MKLLLPFFAIVILPFTSLAARAEEPASSDGQRKVVEMAVRDLEPIEDQVEEAARNELKILQHVNTDMREFLDHFGAIRETVEKHVRAFVEEPTKERAAALDGAVAQAAVQAAAACRGLVESGAKIHQLTALVARGLDVHIKDARSMHTRAEGHAAQFRTRTKDLKTVVRKLADALRRSGARGPEDLSPEAADKLFRLKVDVDAAALLVGVWDEIARQAENHAKALEGTKEDYQVVGSTIDRLAYKASSMEEVFDVISIAGGLRLKHGLLTLQGHSREIREAMDECFRGLAVVDGTAGSLQAAMQGQSIQVPSRPDAGPRPELQSLWTWANELEGGEKSAADTPPPSSDTPAPVAARR